MKNSITIAKTSVFPATQQAVFERLKSVQTLQYIAAPYATFVPLDADFVWQAGKTFRFRFFVFGVLPFGTHVIEVKEFDAQKGRIFTHEHNPQVPVWHHTILLEPIGQAQVKYTDVVEIQAGWKTPFIALWARCFYAHRQKKWLKLLNNSAKTRA